MILYQGLSAFAEDHQVDLAELDIGIIDAIVADRHDLSLFDSVASSIVLRR